MYLYLKTYWKHFSSEIFIQMHWLLIIDYSWYKKFVLWLITGSWIWWVRNQSRFRYGRGPIFVWTCNWWKSVIPCNRILSKKKWNRILIFIIFTKCFVKISRLLFGRRSLNFMIRPSKSSQLLLKMYNFCVQPSCLKPVIIM